MFRGPNASGVADGEAPPISWDGENGRNLVWKTAIPGFGHSSPVVWDNKICVTTAISSDPTATFEHTATSGRIRGDDATQSWQVWCLDKRTGETLWSRTAHTGKPKIGRHAKASHANATPATDGERLIVFFGSEGLYAYDFSGELLWKRDLGVLDAGYVGLPEYQWGTASSPIIHENLVIVQCDSRQDSFIAAFDIASGEEVWMTRRDELPSWSTPVIFDGGERRELITNSPNYFRGMDPRTGRELWKFFDDAQVKVPTPVLGHGLFFFTGGNPRGRQFYAIRPGGRGDISLGPGEQTNEHVAWRIGKGGPYTPSPIVYGDFLYVLSDNAVLRCYRATTGELVYERRVPEGGGSYSASPIAADGRLYLTSEDGDVLVIRSGPNFELVATNPMGEVLMATPAISDGTLFVRGEHHVFAIREP
jgi:outer membrane protein assembly factor BamB